MENDIFIIDFACEYNNFDSKTNVSRSHFPSNSKLAISQARRNMLELLEFPVPIASSACASLESDAKLEKSQINSGLGTQKILNKKKPNILYTHIIHQIPASTNTRQLLIYTCNQTITSSILLYSSTNNITVIKFSNNNGRAPIL